MPPESRRGAMTTQSQTAPAPQLPSGFATMANAPVNAELRDNAKWQEWCFSQPEAQKAKEKTNVD